jgi:hypothetical protein
MHRQTGSTDGATLRASKRSYRAWVAACRTSDAFAFVANSLREALSSADARSALVAEKPCSIRRQRL